MRVLAGGWWLRIVTIKVEKINCKTVKKINHQFNGSNTTHAMIE